MTYREQKLMENEEIRERFFLGLERIREIPEELAGLKGSGLFSDESLCSYFSENAEFILKAARVYAQCEDGSLYRLPFGQKKLLNQELFAMQLAYEDSFLNPVKTVRCFGKEMGSYLCYLGAQLQSLVPFAYDLRLWDMTIWMELFLEIYQLFLSMEEDEKDLLLEQIHQAVYYHERDYLGSRSSQRVRELLCVEESPVVDWMKDADLSSDEYLYDIGLYVGENELATAAYLRKLPKEQIEQLARVYTEGYRKGFEAAHIDLSEKKTVNIRYCLGFERLVLEAIFQFEKMGLSSVIYRDEQTSMNRKLVPSGFFGTPASRQFLYDHRFDYSVYLDKAYIDQRLDALMNAYEEYQEQAGDYAGPAVIEVFGEALFSPVAKEESISLDEKKRKLHVEYSTRAGNLMNQYIDQSKTSFTIIAFPVVQIGKDYEAIFQETVRVNSLDVTKYQQIQQKLIDALDQGQSVLVTGRDGNETKLRIALTKRKNPAKETLFENCLADVNIPLGEVFTSPKLEGTNGLLHVKEVYLEGIRYTDLRLQFEDGFVKDYSCNEGKEAVFENILASHDTLPMGEFAIGTNTTAYAMGQKYQIFPYLPILIAEKMGPHFAVGDTCYSRAEKVRVYNPDGKEIIAKENSCSVLRDTEPDKAYFNCHTDVTIPYTELGNIVVEKENGDTILIIQNGRFVLEGTTQLNDVM